MAGEESEWFYVDSTGQEFGPFPSSTMRGWFQQGFFPMQGDLLVRLSHWADHVKIGTIYPDPISETAFDGPPQENAPSGGGGGGRVPGQKTKGLLNKPNRQGGSGGRGGGGKGKTGGNNGAVDVQLSQQMGSFDAMMPGAGLWGGMMPGAMQQPGLAQYGLPPMRPGGYSPMSPFGGMPMMPSGPGLTTGRFHGRIKSFNAQKGFGFIECPEAHAIYGRDVFLHKAQIGDFSIGSELSFGVEMNKSNMPQARDLTEVDQFALAAGAMGMGGLPFMGGAMGMGGNSGLSGGGNKGGSKGKGKGKSKPKGKGASKKGNNPEDSD